MSFAVGLSLTEIVVGFVTTVILAKSLGHQIFSDSWRALRLNRFRLRAVRKSGPCFNGRARKISGHRQMQHGRESSPANFKRQQGMNDGYSATCQSSCRLGSAAKDKSFGTGYWHLPLPLRGSNFDCQIQRHVVRLKKCLLNPGEVIVRKLPFLRSALKIR
jgi:hypothetical protein